MKEKILVRRACFMICGGYLGIFLIGAAAGIGFYQKGILTGKALACILAVDVLLLLLLLRGVDHCIVRPYRLHKQKIQHFIGSSQYADLLEGVWEIYEGELEVWRRFDKMLDKQNIIQLSTKHAELLALQNQINPHFLYNTLEAIRGDALCEGMEDIADTTEALSTFFRYTISDTRNLVTLEDELENIENYFKIQKYRFGNRIALQVDFPEDYARVLQCRLPKLTLQPMVENAVFHGLESKGEGGLVLISIDSTANKLLLSIQDDGGGIPEEELHRLNEKLESPEVKTPEKKKGGIALTNVSRRIKLLFGEEYGVHLFSIQGVGTDVQVTVPMIYEDQAE